MVVQSACQAAIVHLCLAFFDISGPAYLFASSAFRSPGKIPARNIEVSLLRSGRFAWFSRQIFSGCWTRPRIRTEQLISLCTYWNASKTLSSACGCLGRFSQWLWLLDLFTSLIAVLMWCDPISSLSSWTPRYLTELGGLIWQPSKIMLISLTFFLQMTSIALLLYGTAVSPTLYIKVTMPSTMWLECSSIFSSFFRFQKRLLKAFLTSSTTGRKIFLAAKLELWRAFALFVIRYIADTADRFWRKPRRDFWLAKTLSLSPSVTSKPFASELIKQMGL